MVALTWRKWKNIRLYLPALIWHLRHQPGYSHFNLTWSTWLTRKRENCLWRWKVSLELARLSSCHKSRCIYCLSSMWWATPSVRISPSHHDKKKRTLASSFCFLISAILNNFWGKQNINSIAWWLSHVHENWKPQLFGLSWDKNSQNACKDPNDSCLQIDPKIFLMRFWYVSLWLNQEIQMLEGGKYHQTIRLTILQKQKRS